MKSFALLVLALACLQLATASPLTFLNSFRGKTVNGRQLPSSFFNFVDGINYESHQTKRQTQISPACQAAVEAFQGAPQCQFEEGVNPDPVKMCSDTCKNVMEGISTSCTAAGDEANLGALFGFLEDLICLKDGDTYCFSTFTQLENLDATTLTEEILDNVCSPCFYKVLNLIFSHPLFRANVSAEEVKNINAFFDILCTRADGQWCYFTLQDAFCPDNDNQPEGSQVDVGCLVNNLNVLCKNRCFKKILAKLWLFADPTSQDAQNLQTFLKFACIQDSGDYCLARFAVGYNNFNRTCDQATMESQGCSNTVCRNAAGTLIDTMGCCFETWLDFAKENGNNEDKTNAVNIEKALTDPPCSFTLAPACPRQTGNNEARKTFYIRMTWFWAATHDATVRDAVRRDLAAFLGVPVEDVVLVTFGKDNEDLDDEEAGVAVEFTAKGQTDDETDDLSQEFDDAVASGVLTLPTTSTAYASQGVIAVNQDPKRSDPLESDPLGSDPLGSDASTVAAFAALTLVAAAVAL